MGSKRVVRIDEIMYGTAAEAQARKAEAQARSEMNRAKKEMETAKAETGVKFAAFSVVQETPNKQLKKLDGVESVRLADVIDAITSRVAFYPVEVYKLSEPHVTLICRIDGGAISWQE